MSGTQAPILQFTILCDAIGKDQFGKPAYLGVFDQFLRPGVIPQFFVAFKWIYGLGEHKFSFRFLGPDLGVIQRFDDIKMKFEKKTDNAQVQIQLVNINLKKAGVHWIEVFLNGETYYSIPLPVHDLKS